MTTPSNQARLRLLSRRQFLKTSLAMGIAGSALDWLVPGDACAAGFSGLSKPILVNIALDGGPDMRHLLPPAWNNDSGSFGRRYWQVRARAHRAEGGASASQAAWQSNFFPVSQGRTSFGISRKCGFLKQLWDSGNLALINNVYGATSRDHQHARLVLDQGNMAASKSTQGSGWGGRLAVAGGGNAVALSSAARQFALGPDPQAPNDLTRIDKSSLLHIADMRAASLYQPDPTAWQGPPQFVARSLKSYYAAKRPAIGEQSPYAPFMDHERKWRILGDQIDVRLKGLPMPPALTALGAHKSWYNAYIGQQARNLYDALACHDLLNMRVASLEHPGWDTHGDQAVQIEPLAEHLFGSNGVLDTLYQVLPPTISSRLVFVIGGEFGRQLSDNGARGTDHGVGTTMLVLGNPVRGGVYGEMFPEAELARLDEPGADIAGLTALDHVFGAVCDWLTPQGKNVVFPAHHGHPRESGLALETLFS